MDTGRSRNGDARIAELPPSPVCADEWEQIVRELGLPPRQAKIVDLILRGLADKQIASELNLSFSTVRTYLERVFARLEVPDRIQLVLRIFFEHNKRAGVGNDHDRTNPDKPR